MLSAKDDFWEKGECESIDGDIYVTTNILEVSI